MPKTSEVIHQCVNDQNGKISSKRVVLLCTLGTVIVVSLANTFFGFSPAEFIFEGLMWIMLVSMGAGTAEFFSKKKK